MRASPAVSHHDPAPNEVAIGAGLVACVVCLGGEWAGSLPTGVTSRGAAGLGHAGGWSVLCPRPLADPRGDADARHHRARVPEGPPPPHPASGRVLHVVRPPVLRSPPVQARPPPQGSTTGVRAAPRLSG